MVRHRLGSAPGRHARSGTVTQQEELVDQLLKDAQRLVSVGTFFIIAGWVFVIYALVAGLIWWIDLAQRPAFNWFEALALSAGAIGLPIFAAFLIAGLGYFLRLFALYAATHRE
jgi:TRAP-type C4-dicarboxylate transport system permease small subunit